MNSNPITDAIGALKLVPIVHYHPDVVSADAMLGAAREAVERLQAIDPAALELAEVYRVVAAELAPGQTLYVTPTTDAVRPYGAVVTDAAGVLIVTAAGKTIDGLAMLVRMRLPAGRGEAVA
ncbi:hypothetical protein [uncultured Stutzerimonas sp.]|uniref:hypothetical protein n=1 Tax=uncultured Stutzerimonas sp. TaxID=2901168 RepID=UPI0032B0F8E0|tara:strand:- start:2329 stop:2694 length:366 start_codon:yes stop_codon:yes gene_type:complete